MRVTGPTGTPPAAQTGGPQATGPQAGVNAASATARAANASQLFELALNAGGGAATPASSGLVGMTPMNGLDAILALQEVARDIGSRKRMIRRGHDMLDRLDEIKVGLLSGKVDGATMERIVDLLSQREPSGDDRIDGLMDEIDLRARVEMAKLGHFSDEMDK